MSASEASVTDWGTTLGPSCSANDASVSGPREFAIATWMLLRAKTRASAVQIFPEPITAYFIRISSVPRALYGTLTTDVSPVASDARLRSFNWERWYVSNRPSGGGGIGLLRSPRRRLYRRNDKVEKRARLRRKIVSRWMQRI